MTTYAALKFLLSQFEENESLFAYDMKIVLVNRIEQRRQAKLSGVLSYLRNPRRQVERDFDLIKTLFATPSQKVVRSRIRDLLERLNRSCNVEIDCNNDSVEEDVSQVLDTSKESSTSKKIKNYPLSLKEQLRREIVQNMNSPCKNQQSTIGRLTLYA